MMDPRGRPRYRMTPPGPAPARGVKLEEGALGGRVRPPKPIEPFPPQRKGAGMSSPEGSAMLRATA